MLATVEAPRTLFVTGGETLLAVASTLGATHLDVDAVFAPGVPWSRRRGGRRDDVAVLSRSGAFGSDDLLVRIVEATAPDADCF